MIYVVAFDPIKILTCNSQLAPSFVLFVSKQSYYCKQFSIFQIISEKSDTEWKFSRTKLWISFFETGSTVPPPFNIMPTPKVDTVQDFLIKLGIKPCMDLLEVSIFSLNIVVIRPTKIMYRPHKNWAHF